MGHQPSKRRRPRSSGTGRLIGDPSAGRVAAPPDPLLDAAHDHALAPPEATEAIERACVEVDAAVYREVVAVLAEGVALIHAERTDRGSAYRFAFANPAFERALGLAPGVFGLALDEALPNLDDHWFGARSIIS